jgi:hypothetical protein
VQSTRSTPAANVALAHFLSRSLMDRVSGFGLALLLLGAEHQIRSPTRKVERTSKRRSQVNFVPPGLGVRGGLVICKEGHSKRPMIALSSPLAKCS